MKEYLTPIDLVAYRLAGITEISASSPVSRFPEEKEPTKEEHEIEQVPSFSLDHIKSLSDLLNELKSFEGCYIKKTATNTVFNDGNENAKIMIIGDVPGKEEDKQGIPFLGEAGILLDKMLGSIGLSRKDDCYLTNMIPWRPPGNRSPSASEIVMCLPFLKKHIEIINPDFIVFLGVETQKALLDNNLPISKARGNWVDYSIEKNGKKVKTITTYHPSFLIKSPAQKKYAWIDLLNIKEALNF